MTEMIIIFLLFVVGAGAGSFVDAAVERLRAGYKLSGRSRCDKCRHALSAAELVPVVAWLVLRGRCQKCRAKIGVRALLVELATGCFFAASYWFWTFDMAVSGVLFGLWLVVVAGLMFLLVYDARYRLLPNRVLYPVLAVLAIFWMVSSVTSEQNICSIMLNLGLAMLPIAGVYGLIFLVSRGRLVGFGDVKLGVVIGFLLPWWGGVMVLGLANVLALLIALPLILTKKTKLNARLPFAPFLILATFLVFFVVKLFVDFPQMLIGDMGINLGS
jgi:prepilin signal peptidase PulO-like enzyme (type II secretory pathway)